MPNRAGVLGVRSSFEGLPRLKAELEHVQDGPQLEAVVGLPAAPPVTAHARARMLQVTARIGLGTRYNRNKDIVNQYITSRLF